LIEIDNLYRTFQNQYDLAGFVDGDDDFRDLINSVKELAGKRVYGFYFSHNPSKKSYKNLIEKST
jgi:hypothetical protein